MPKEFRKPLKRGEVRLLLVESGSIELLITPVLPWHSFDICNYLNQGIAYIDGDRIFKRGCSPLPQPSLMGHIIERTTDLPRGFWTPAKEIKKAPKPRPVEHNTFRLAARNVAAGELHIVPAKTWSPSYICQLLNMGIAGVEAGGTCILKHNGTGFSQEWSDIAKVTYRHQTAPHYRWAIEADASRRCVRKSK